MARKYSKASQDKVEKVMRERNAGTLRSGRSGKKVTSRKQSPLAFPRHGAKARRFPKRAQLKDSRRESSLGLKILGPRSTAGSLPALCYGP
jgi:hypothetical protein